MLVHGVVDHGSLSGEEEPVGVNPSEEGCKAACSTTPVRCGWSIDERHPPADQG